MTGISREKYDWTAGRGRLDAAKTYYPTQSSAVKGERNLSYWGYSFGGDKVVMTL